MKIFWAVKFDPEKTVESMIDYYNWRKDTLPIQPTDKGIQLLVRNRLLKLYKGIRVRLNSWKRF